MVVFIVMDDVGGSSSVSNSNSNSNDDGNNNDNRQQQQHQQQKQSVLNLKTVRFLGGDEIRTEYYLDTFPFQYYLVVRNLADLPGALAGLLRTWFAEVNA
ncbi:hypothetical protein GGR56DRAFT_624598 [Xylariaceae sp. FL0804]|nr:hypothetical protein GGR56DRAFT_624598 [Xylariaceae sp. FL0804]